MTFLKILFGLAVVLLVGGFTYLAVMDVPIQHTQVVKTLPNDRFLNAQ